MKKNLISFIIIILPIFSSAQSIVLTDVYFEKNGFLISYESVRYKEIYGTIITFSDTINYNRIRFDTIIKDGGLIYKAIEKETAICLIWNLQNPFKQSENHIILNVPDSLFYEQSDLYYCDLKFSNNIYKGKIIKEFIEDDLKIVIREICFSGLVLNSKYGKSDLFIDGKLDTQYVKGNENAKIFIPFNSCQASTLY